MASAVSSSTSSSPTQTSSSPTQTSSSPTQTSSSPTQTSSSPTQGPTGPTGITPKKAPLRPDTIELPPPPDELPEKGGGCCKVIWQVIVSFFEAIGYFFKWLFCLLEDPDKAAEDLAAKAAAAEAAAKLAEPPRKNEAEQAFDKAFPIDDGQRKALNEIFFTLGTTNLIFLANKQSHLKELGDKTRTIFPLKMLSWVFRFYENKEHLLRVKEQDLIFTPYIEEFAQSLSDYCSKSDKEQFSYHMKGFCQYADLHPQLILTAIERAQKKSLTSSHKEILISAFTREPSEEETDGDLEASLKQVWDPIFTSMNADQWESFSEQMFDLLVKKREEADEKKKIEAFCKRLKASNLKEFCNYPSADPQRLLDIVLKASPDAEVEQEYLVEVLTPNGNPKTIQEAWGPLLDSLTEEDWASCTVELVEHLFFPTLPSYPFAGIEMPKVDIFSVSISETKIEDLLTTYATSAITPQSNHTKKWTGVTDAHPLRFIQLLFSHPDSGTHARRISHISKILTEKSIVGKNKKEHFIQRFSSHLTQTIESEQIIEFCEKLSLEETTIRPLIDELDWGKLLQHLIGVKAPQKQAVISELNPLTGSEQAQVDALVLAYNSNLISTKLQKLTTLWGPLKHIHPLRLLLACSSDTNRAALQKAFAPVTKIAKNHFIRNFPQLTETVSEELLAELLQKLPTDRNEGQKALIKEGIRVNNWGKVFDALLEKTSI